MLGKLLAKRYKLMTILGAGGFGQTYLAEDIQAARRCVVKQFQPTTRDTKFLEVARRLFQTEAETLKRLGTHEQIPELYDYFEEDEEFYLVQEFIDGVSLASELTRKRRLSEADVIAILHDVLNVLQFVHQHQVIHRDIKPGNLIRRQEDGRIVLIDFGAVKEIRTQFSTGVGSGLTGFTVGIGTQGYMPSEQLMGRPRYSSDVYALGMTAVQAVTGLSPSHLPDDPNSMDVLWKDQAAISLGLEFILDRMVRQDYSQRYPSADAVVTALQRLTEIPTDATEIPAEMLLPDSLLNQPWTQPVPKETWRQMVGAGVKAIAIASASVTALLLGMRQVGLTEPMELAAYDQMMRFHTPSEDPRILTVGITENDLQELQRSTPSDATLAQAMAILQELNPAVVGLDLLRDLPQNPGRTELLKQLEAENVIAIMTLSETEEEIVPAPENVPPERVGFNDLPIDPDGVVRRSLLFASVEENSYFSFANRLALAYLAEQGIEPQNPDPEDRELIQLGAALMRPLEPTSGGYQYADAGGYQILLRYPTSSQPGRIVSLSDVLEGNLDPEWVEDKIVLIGTVAPSGKDLFYTPYSAGQQEEHQMPGVIIHAQMASQLVQAAAGDQPLFWYMADWAEVVWIVGWSLVGGVLGWFVRHPIVLGVSTTTWILIVLGGGIVLFNQGAWIPVVTPAIALFVTNAGVSVFRLYRDYSRQRKATQWLTTSTITATRTLQK
ncbi:CHASE2 domain-containing protein [Vacuolonema iberomarrocanum]|uniref:CHASE2 domain-containing protein n=1 Tax=Vacuolonema iberomarrocanum TaxID=3454632 RepID=UPI0019FF5F46|nr:CHASE2 domain-containing protein [filamentous cyanobacterium LEGE 07170]